MIEQLPIDQFEEVRAMVYDLIEARAYRAKADLRLMCIRARKSIGQKTRRMREANGQ